MIDIEAASTAVDREDARLVGAVRAGQAWAHRAIWDRYSDRVRRFFARSALPEVDDLTQDVFLRVFLGHARIEKPTSLRHYVMAIAMTVRKQQFRRHRVRRVVCLSATGEMPDIATPARADNEARHELARCYEILSGIRMRERVAFVLRYLEGMRLVEVAERMNVSTATAKRLIRRAARKVSTRVAEGASASVVRAPRSVFVFERGPAESLVHGRR